MRISPKYKNYVEMNSSNYENAKPIDFDLKIGEWNTIPTKEDFIVPEFKDGGEIHRLPIFPGENIRAELVYKGEIECINEETSQNSNPFITEKSTYPIQNSLFHSENMKRLTKEHYLFETNYFPRGEFALPTLDEVRNWSSKTPNKGLLKKIFGDDLNKTQEGHEVKNIRYSLGQIFNKVIDASDRGEDERDYGYYDFDELMKEYLSTGKIDGDCKADSTFTAGLLDAAGFKSRIIDGSVMHGNKPIEIGHVWTEVFLPLNERKGHWLPIDTSLGNFLAFPEDETYHFDRVQLPSFKDQSIEEAKLRLTYV